MNFIDQIVDFIIRPARDRYRISRLGPKRFAVSSKQTKQQLTVSREDCSITTPEKRKIEMSYFAFDKKQNIRKPCVVYLHGNSGSKNEGMPYVKQILEREMEVAIFDFIGSGESEGSYVTLGVEQSRNISTIIDYIVKNKNVNDIFLWGRSMGAVAVLIYLSENPYRIQGAAFDSPFSSLIKLICQLANQKTKIPQFVCNTLIPYINQRVQNKTNISIKDLEIVKIVKKIQGCPGLFITSKKDKLVSSSQTQQLFQNYNGPKVLHYIQFQHHQFRGDDLTCKILNFFQSNSIRNIRHLINDKSFIQMLDDCRQTDIQTPQKQMIKDNKISLSSLLRKNPIEQKQLNLHNYKLPIVYDQYSQK